MSKSNNAISIPTLVLPREFRRDLSIPQGTLYIHEKGGAITGLRTYATVGDIVSKRHISTLKIIDYKTKRHEAVEVSEKCDWVVVNPPGGISINSLTILSVVNHGTICVIGEEDLLVIPLLRKSNEGIVYGQPNTGVVVTKASVIFAIKIFKILKPALIQIGLK